MPPPHHNQSGCTPGPGLDYTFRCQYLIHQPSISTSTPFPPAPANIDKVSTSPQQSLPSSSSSSSSPAAVPELTPIYRSLFVTCSAFEQILDLGTLRYHLLLTYNPAYTYCAENICLRALYDALLAKDDARQRLSANSCVNLFLPTLRKDHAARMTMGPCSDEYDDPYTGERGPVIKLQAATTPRQLGLEFTAHESPRRYPPVERCMVRNMHVGVLTFDRNEVELGRDMQRGLYAAVVAGRRCWVKPGHCYYNAAALRREVDALVRTPRQHSIMQLVGLVAVDGTGTTEEGEEMVDGVVLRARRGKVRQLSGIKTCSRTEGWRWKSQIGEAVGLLHRAAVIWGRAVPENVMIDRDGNALIMDFSGGPAGDTRETDMMGLYQVFDFIDRITKFADEMGCNDADGSDEGDGNGLQDQSNDYDIDDDYLADLNAPYW